MRTANNSLLLRFYSGMQKRHPSILWQGDGSRREIALTFDDGPHSKDTPQVLETLAKHKVHATFFLVGKYVEQYPHLVRLIHQNGHQIGIHCYHHIPFPLENPTKLRAQLTRTQNSIAQICGIAPEGIREVRPPYGMFTRNTLYLLTSWGYQLVMWNNIPQHWMQPLSWTVKQVLGNTIPGSIIVLHDGHGHGTKVAQIIESVIPKLRTEGFKLVLIDEMRKGFL